MVFATETTDFPHIEIKPEALARLPFGVASPLWGFYTTAALSGVAYWWMTQWTRPVNLEALFGQAAATAQPVVEAVEAAAGTVVEALAPPELPTLPVGGEAAPISPVAAVAAAADQAEAAIDAGAEAAPQALAEVSVAVADAAQEAVNTTTKAAEEIAAAAKPQPKPVAEPRSVAPKAKTPPEAPRSI